MKKLLFALLIAGLMFAVVGSAFAELDDDPRRSVKGLFKANTDVALTAAEFTVGQDALVGVQSVGLGNLVGIYDGTSLASVIGAGSSAVVSTEAEADNGRALSDLEAFPFRMLFESGVVLIFNNADVDAFDGIDGVILYIEYDYNQYN